MASTQDDIWFVSNTGERYPAPGPSTGPDEPWETDGVAGTNEVSTSPSTGGELPQGSIESPPGIQQEVGVACGIAWGAFHDTTNWPYRTICKLYVKFKGGQNWYGGSGFFIGHGTIITSGHVVFDWGKTNTWASEILVIPGRDGNDRPYGSQLVKGSFHSIDKWVENGEKKYDFGAIIMPDHTLGDKVGYFGFGAYTDQTLMDAATASVTGYPVSGNGALYTTPADGLGGTLAGVDQDFLTYTYDTSGGQSGSPVWFVKADGQVRAVGIHRGSTEGGCPNEAVRINHRVFDFLKSWKEKGG